MQKTVFSETAIDEKERYLSEQSILVTSYDPDSMILPYNPDDIVQKNQDYSTYSEMLKDDAVSSCALLKKEMVLCNGFDFISSEDDHEEIVKDLKIALCEDPDGSFEEMLEEILTAYDYGFSISEKIFKKRNDGKLSLKSIKTRHPGPWMIHQDEFGNITKYEQRGAKNPIIDSKKIIHFVNKPKFGNPYGSSDLRSAFNAWFAKKHIVRWYSIFIEKAGSPIPVGKYDEGKASQEAKTGLYNALKKFQTKSALVIPKEFEVEFLEAKTNGDVFKNAINIFNLFIGRSLLIPDLLGFSGSETAGGAYALGEKQLEIFFNHINRRRSVLERLINTQLVWPIVLYNFGYIDNYPKFKFRPISDKQTVEYLKLWLDAVKARVYEPSPEEIAHFKNILNLPSQSDELKEVEDEEIEKPDEEKEDDEQEIDIQEHETNDGDFTVFGKVRKFGDTSGPFSKRTNFQLIEQTLDSFIQRQTNATAPIVAESLQQIIDKVVKYKVEKPESIEKIKLSDSNKLVSTLKKTFKELHNTGFEIAQSELLASQFAKPLVDEAFLAVLESELAQFAIDWTDTINKKVKLTVIQAIKDGLSVKQTVSAIQSQIPEIAKSSIERFVRTKNTEIMNKGRLNFFEKSGLIGAYQYSAVLDDRTTTICRGLHGKIFMSGDQPIPPMHFNCRSLLIPLTKYDIFEPSSKVGKTPINDFIEENKGAGFPKQ